MNLSLEERWASSKSEIRRIDNARAELCILCHAAGLSALRYSPSGESIMSITDRDSANAPIGAMSVITQLATLLAPAAKPSGSGCKSGAPVASFI